MTLDDHGILRLKEVVKMLGLPPEKLSEIVFQSPQAIFDYFRGKERDLSQYSKMVLQSYFINLDWLATGKGKMSLPYVVLNPVDSEEQVIFNIYRKLDVKFQKELLQVSHKLSIQSSIDLKKIEKRKRRRDF